jgi:chorismate synthase
VSANRFGHLFSVTTFGESHGSALGCVIDGCPAGVEINKDRLQKWLERRRPGQSAVVTSRQESDQVEIVSGVFANKTLGTPIAMFVRNHDARSKDYARESVPLRPGHATDLWDAKFGHSDFRGSGRASGRETVARVMAGAVAEMFLQQAVPQIQVLGFVSQLGPWSLNQICLAKAREAAPWSSEAFVARFPDASLSVDIEAGLLKAKAAGESFGGVCELVIRGAPKGLGQPVFHKFKADLGAAMLGVGATSAVEFGEGFAATSKVGSEFHSEGQSYGGIRGGIATGEPIDLKVAFKPTSTLGKMAKEGRHDPAILPRALPVLEAMAWLVLADHFLWQRLDKI